MENLEQQELARSVPRIRRSVETLKRGRQLFLIFSILILFAVIGAYGVIYFYSGRLVQQNAGLKEQLAAAENEVDPELIKRLVLIATTLENGQKLLTNHLMTSNMFTFLERSTHPKIAYGSFSYSEGVKKIELPTIADTFAVLARQIAVYEASDELTDLSFSGLSTDQDGNIAFKLTLGFKPDLIHYKSGQ